MSKDNGRLEQLLECLIQVIGRAAVPMEKVQEIVGVGTKQIKAFNLLDGKTKLGDVAKKTKLDRGNLSRTINRWVENGIVFKFDNGELMHIYPMPQNPPKKSAKNTRKRK